MIYGIKYIQQFIAGSSSTESSTNDQVNPKSAILDEAQDKSESGVNKADDPEFINKEILRQPDYATDHATIIKNDGPSIFGVLKAISDDGYIIDANSEEYFLPLTKLRWNLIEGDKVKIFGSIKEEGFDVGEKFVAAAIEPIMRKNSDFAFDYGRVTKIKKDFAVFDRRDLFVKSSVPNAPHLTMNQELKYVAIETEQNVDGKVFKSRIVEFIEQEPKANDIESRILIDDADFSIISDEKRNEEKYIMIRNKSQFPIKLMKCKLNPPAPAVIRVQREGFKDKPIYVIAQNRSYKASIDIFPRTIGKHEFIFIADFMNHDKSTIQKKCKVSLEIVFAATNVRSGRSLVQRPRFIEIRFEEHNVPAELRTIDWTKVKPSTDNLTQQFPVLLEEINEANFLKKMQFGIYLDELAMEQAFLGYRIQKTRFKNQDDFLKLEVKDVSEKRPSIILGDKVEAIALNSTIGDQRKYIGNICKVENDAILAKFDKEFHETIHHGKVFTVDFIFSRNPFKQRHHALETVLSMRGLGCETLFPSLDRLPNNHPRLYVNLDDNERLSMFRKPHKWFDNKLNKYQRQAVVNVLRGECRPIPYIIYGPPGTGKTMTIVELIMQLFFLDPTTRLIVATPSNSAANLFTEALIKSEQFKDPHDFIRFVSNNQLEKELIPDYLLKYCGTISIADDDRSEQVETFFTESGLRMNCTKSKIVNYRICIGTLSCFGAMMHMKFPSDHFTHVIVDEAGQSTEPETLIPITQLAKTGGQIVLAGDPKQLGPIMISRYAQKLKLESSMLERLLNLNNCYAKMYGDNGNEYDPRFVTKLKINYRSVPSILRIYNDLFYNAELEGVIDGETSSEADLLTILEDSLWNKTAPNRTGSFYFINVAKGRNRKEKDSPSWYNEAEMGAIISFLNKISSCNVPFKDVGIITPYALQVKKLKHKVSVSLTDTDLKIGTVEEFQGQERQIILVSTVRTEERHTASDSKFGLGFLHCAKRMNVAISRARALLVVFGKREMLEKDSHWKKLIDFSVANGTYVNDERT